MLGDQSDTQLIIEPLSGWRSWKVSTGGAGPVLHSPDRGDVWQDGQLSWNGTCACGATGKAMSAAQRMAILSTVPIRSGEPCLCGINAFADREQLALSRYMAHEAVGRCQLWGQVRQYEQGWRGEHARVVELWATSEDAAPAVSAVAERIGAVYQGVAGDQFIDWRAAADTWTRPHRAALRRMITAVALLVLVLAYAAFALITSSNGPVPALICALALTLAMHIQIRSVSMLFALGDVHPSDQRLPGIAHTHTRLMFWTALTMIGIGGWAPVVISLLALV